MEAKNAESANFFLLLIIILVVVIVPVYSGLIGSIVWIYGPSYMKYGKDPVYIIKFYAQLLEYWRTYRTQLPQDFLTKLVAPPGGAFVGSAILMFLMRAPLIDFRPFKKPESIHGDARWSDEKDMRKAGVRAKKGVMLGRTGKNNYLIAGGYQHILLFAPTGSGKGVGFVIPNLLFWDESVVIHDIKLENYDLSSGWRSKKLKQQVYCWNPADPDGRTHCYNPVDWVSDKAGQQVDDVQKIANLLLPEQEFWQNEARSLFVGVLLYLVAVPEKVKSFGEVVRTMRSDDVVYTLAVVLDTIGKKIHPVAYMNIASFLQKADKERSGVISTMNSSLELWANPLIDTATASSDFDMQNLRREKMSIFVGVTPDNLQRLKPLLQVFYQQCADFMTRKMPTKDEKHGVLMLMDEFPTLGEMPQFEAGIAYFRGYKVRLFLIVQDTQQLKGIYEEAGMNSFLSNATFRITFAANNVETANLISQLIGNKTVKQYSYNKPRFLDLNPSARTMHESEVSRALLLPQEVINMPRDEQIILIEAFPPIRTKKIFYFQDSFFTKRLMPAQVLPIQEPYDPRKKQAPKPKPGSKPAEDSKAATPPPPPPPAPPAAPEKPPEPPKGAAPALPPLPSPKEDSKAAAALPPLPPLPAPAAVSVKDNKEPAKPAAANPFDLPPLPPKPAGDNKTALPPLPPLPSPKEESKATTAELPPLPPLPAASKPKEEVSKTSESKPAATSPFDLPPLTPTKPAAVETKAPESKKADNPFDLPPLTPAKPVEQVEAKKAEPEKVEVKEEKVESKPTAVNPFDLPPLVATKDKKIEEEAEEAEDEEEEETEESDSSGDSVKAEVVEEEKPKEKEKMEEEKAEKKVAASDPFDLPPIPPKAVPKAPVKDVATTSEDGGSSSDMPPLPPKPVAKVVKEKPVEEEVDLPKPALGNDDKRNQESVASKAQPEEEILKPFVSKADSLTAAAKKSETTDTETKIEVKSEEKKKEEMKATLVDGVPSFFAGPSVFGKKRDDKKDS